MSAENRNEGFDLSAHLDADLLDELRAFAPDWKPGDPVRPAREAVGEPDSEWTRIKLHLLQVFLE